MTTLEIERFPVPDTSRRARTIELMRLRTLEPGQPLTGLLRRIDAMLRAGGAAYISARRGIEAKEADVGSADQPSENLVWTTALADVVTEDRAERVGGKLHARPSIPAR